MNFVDKNNSKSAVETVDLEGGDMVRTEVEVEFDIPFGEYSVNVIHDTYKTGSLTTNMVGIPNDGFCTSGSGYKTGSMTWATSKIPDGFKEDNQLVEMDFFYIPMISYL